MSLSPYYEHKGIQIFHGDCREVLPELPEADLILTDPPYQFENSGGGFYGAWEGRNQGSHDPRTYLNELRDLNCVDCEPSSFLPLFGNASAVIFCNKALIAEYLQFAQARKFLYDVHVLSKLNPIPVKSHHFIHDLEYIVIFRAKQSYFDDSGPMHLYRKLFQVSCGGDVQHPAQKPDALLAKYAVVLSAPDGNNSGSIPRKWQHSSSSKEDRPPGHRHRDRREVLRNCRQAFKPRGYSTFRR